MMCGKDETRMDVFQYTQKKEKRKQRNKDAVRTNPQPSLALL